MFLRGQTRLPRGDAANPGLTCQSRVCSRRWYPLGMVSTNPEPQISSRFVPRLGSDAEFATVRGMLAECGFTPERICERLGIAGMGEYKPIWRGRGNLLAAERALDALILLLMDGEYVAEGTLERLLPAGAVGQMEALILLLMDGEYVAEGTLE